MNPPVRIAFLGWHDRARCIVEGRDADAEILGIVDLSPGPGHFLDRSIAGDATPPRNRTAGQGPRVELVGRTNGVLLQAPEGPWRHDPHRNAVRLPLLDVT